MVSDRRTWLANHHVIFTDFQTLGLCIEICDKTNIAALWILEISENDKLRHVTKLNK